MLGLRKNSFFWGRRFICLPGVYVPKYETEHIVDIVLNLVSDNCILNPRILDIGLGTGCIAITLKLEIPNAKVYGIEKDSFIFKNACMNAILYRINANFYNNNFMDYINGHDVYQFFDIIVSNPPYLNIFEFMHKHGGYKNKSDLRFVNDFRNCVGSIRFINRMLELCNAKYIVLELSAWQCYEIKSNKYKILSVLVPFVNSKIVFLIMKSASIV